MDSLIDVLASVCFALLSLAGFLLRQFLAKKIANQELLTVLTRVADASFAAVQSVAQGYADDIKAASADGKLTEEERKTAREEALRRMKLLLGELGMAQVKKVFGLDGSHLDEALLSRIESAVKARKP